jgi:putative ABC transport system substrate-binding protein
MHRRRFIALLGGAIALPWAGAAQQKAMPVISFLGKESPESDTLRVTPFRRGLNETGYEEGRNVAIEYRWAEGHYDRLPALAADLVRRQVTVIVTLGTLAPGRRTTESVSPSGEARLL